MSLRLVWARIALLNIQASSCQYVLAIVGITGMHHLPMRAWCFCIVDAVTVRSSFVPFACTTRNGVSVLNAEPSIKCNIADPRYRRMRAVGGLCTVLYGLGIPALFAFLLWRYRKEITADQRLRAKAEGETSLTNPQIHIRRRFRKL